MTLTLKNTIDSIWKVFWIISNYIAQLFHNVLSSLWMSKTNKLTTKTNDVHQLDNGVNLNKTINQNTSTRSKNDQINNDELIRPFHKIPGPLSLPFFGTVSTKLNKKDTELNCKYLSQKYGDIVKVEYYWNYPVVILFNADDIHYIQKLASILRPATPVLALHRGQRKDRYQLLGVAHEQGDNWAKLRTLLNPQLLSTRYLRQLTSGTAEIAEDFVQLLHDDVDGRIENFDHLIFRLNFEIACFLILGTRLQILDPKSCHKMNVFIDHCSLYFECLAESFTGFPWFVYFPDKVWTNFVTAEDTLFDTFAEVVEDLQNAGELGGLLSQFLTSKNDLSRNDILTLAMDLVLGALEPVYNSFIFTIYLIAKHAEVDDKLFEELQRLLPTKDWVLDESTTDKMIYLKACIQESYRILPTASQLAKYVNEDVVLRGYHIPADTLFMCQSWHACLQESNFYKAREFLPERWLIIEDEGERSMPYSPHSPKLMYNFGSGRRGCPGQKFMNVEITTALAKLFRNYKVEFLEKLEYGFEYLLTPTSPIPVKLTKRPD